MMLVFIDESGDPGFRIDRGSSPYFVFALVIFDDPLVAEQTSVAIKDLRRKLGKHDDFEFKFDNMSRALRIRFIDTIREYRFRVRAMVVDKKMIHSPQLRREKESFYNFFIMQLLEKSKGHIKDARLKFDKRGEREMRNHLRSYLSQRLDNKSHGIFSDLKFADSRQNTLIQLADIISGSIYCKYSKKDSSYIQKFARKGRVEDIWEFR